MKKLFFIVLVFANLFQSTAIYSRTDKERAYSALGIGIIIIAAASYFYNRRPSAPIIEPISNALDSHNQASTPQTPTSTEANKTEKENSDSSSKKSDNQESNIDNKTVNSKNSLVNGMNAVKDSLLSSLDNLSVIDVNAI